MTKCIPLLLLGLWVGILPCIGIQAYAASSISVAIEDTPYTMDPHGSRATSNLSIAANLFDGLMQHNGPGGILNPALAVQHEHPDLLTWVIYLRKGVKFHNGNPFTAADVKFSFERLSDHRISDFTALVKDIASIEIIDNYTVVIKTKQPVPWFINNCPQLFIMDKESTEKRDQGEVEVKPIGTGAYKLVEWVKGEYLKMEENKEYWEGAPPIKSVELKVIKGFSERIDALTSEQVELICHIPLDR